MEIKKWHLKSRTVPVVVGALGLIKKGTQEQIKKIHGAPSHQDISEIVLSSTAHILQRALFIFFLSRDVNVSFV